MARFDRYFWRAVTTKNGVCGWSFRLRVLLRCRRLLLAAALQNLACHRALAAVPVRRLAWHPVPLVRREDRRRGAWASFCSCWHLRCRARAMRFDPQTRGQRKRSKRASMCILGSSQYSSGTDSNYVDVFDDVMNAAMIGVDADRAIQSRAGRTLFESAHSCPFHDRARRQGIDDDVLRRTSQRTPVHQAELSTGMRGRRTSDLFFSCAKLAAHAKAGQSDRP